MGHLYGVALYYSTSLAERALVGTMHSRPEVLYFWVYYVGFNAPWVVVPLSEFSFPSAHFLCHVEKNKPRGNLAIGRLDSNAG